MTNEFGKPLDKNGYAPSIMQDGNHCYVCYGNLNPIRHEAIHGFNRQKAKEYGLWVNVCPYCHWRIHNTDGKLDRMLKRNAQEAAMTVYGWSVEDFRERFGKNYEE